MPGRSARVVFLLLAVGAGPAPAVTPDEIDAAVKRGAGFLRGRFANAIAAEERKAAGYGIGPAALAGLALLEAGTPPADPALVTITKAVRNAAYTETQTYQASLCLLFLDRLGDPADVPLIQLLGVRLVAGQSLNGGWSYDTVAPPTEAQERELRTRLGVSTLATAPKAAPGKAAPGPAAGRLHAEVEKYARGVLANARGLGGDDNSNTQFAIIALWVARRHGVPADGALAAVELRFLRSEAAGGGWGYNFRDHAATGAMTCAGLLGLATAVALRDERLVATAAKPAAPTPPAPKASAKPDDDPFFRPPAKPDDPFFRPAAKPEPKKAAPPRAGPPPKAGDPREAAIARGFDRLGEFFADRRGGAGRELYFLWSVERVGVVFDRKLIGGRDWYQDTATELVGSQQRGGSWEGGYTPEVSTAFAVLVLRRTNLARDLSTVRKPAADTELRAAAAPPPSDPVHPIAPPAAPAPKPAEPAPKPAAPAPALDTPEKVAARLLTARADGWPAELARVRDGKGAAFTRGLATAAAAALDPGRQKELRAALADRLTRMTPGTLRTLLADDDAEVRRAACLACGMKDDPALGPDLADRLADLDDAVGRAAKASLKSLTGQDHGPPAGASADEKRAAAAEWKRWFAARRP